MATKNGQNEDRGESIGLIEPLLVSEGSRHRSKLADLAITLTEKSASLRSSLPPEDSGCSSHSCAINELLLLQPYRGS